MINTLVVITLILFLILIYAIKTNRKKLIIITNTFTILSLVLLIISTTNNKLLSNDITKTNTVTFENNITESNNTNNGDDKLNSSNIPSNLSSYHNIDENKMQKIRQMIDISEGSSELDKSVAIEYIVYLPEPVIDCLIENNLKIYLTPNAKESCLKLTGYDFGTMAISGVFNYDENTGESIICVNENELWWCLYHEIGHAFDCFNGYNGKYKTSTDSTFETIFHKEKDKIIRDSYMYDYIADNELEYFAESFRYYCENIYNSYEAGLEPTQLQGETYEYISKMIYSQ